MTHTNRTEEWMHVSTAYLDAVSLLYEHVEGRAMLILPLQLLAGRAVESALKSFIYSATGEETDSHDLEQLHDLAEQLGAELTATQRSLILFLNTNYFTRTDQDRKHSARYPKSAAFRWFNDFVRPGEYEELVSVLIEQADQRATEFAPAL